MGGGGGRISHEKATNSHVAISYSPEIIVEKSILSSGSRDGMILFSDVRKADPVVGSSHFHKMEVCGLQWSPDGSKLASGGNDNLVCVWNNKDLSQPEHILKGHEAAVKVS